MKSVYFDECGNTGQNLLDNKDPVFVLASCSLAEEEVSEALTSFHAFQGPELKFSKLRKSPKGQRAVIEFLKSKSINSQNAGAVVFHKPFTVITKYCDLVLEPSMRRVGLNFYERGANIATANLLTTVMPVYLHHRTWENFLALFMQLVRERSVSLFFEWRQSAELIHAHLHHAQPRMASFIAPVVLMQNPNDFLSTIGDDELDPLVPAYHFIADSWGRKLGQRFRIIADESKVVAKEKERLLKLSDPNLKPMKTGYDRRKIEFPLKISDIQPVVSHRCRQVQFADTLAGAIGNALKARIKGLLEKDTFAHDVLQICFSKELIVNALWPGSDVDPAQLETDVDLDPCNYDPAAYAGMILKGHPHTMQAASVESRGENPLPVDSRPFPK